MAFCEVDLKFNFEERPVLNLTVYRRIYCCNSPRLYSPASHGTGRADLLRKNNKLLDQQKDPKDTVIQFYGLLFSNFKADG